MAPRVDLQTLLETITPHVYFQPPTNVRLQYPCIIYARDQESADYAGNNLYKHRKRYLVTVIDTDPDSIIPDAVRNLPFCAFDRHYVGDNLNHDVFNLYF
jgi:hypothetical protein